VTAFGSDHLQQQARNLNVAYLEKPLSLIELLSKVRASITPSVP
jgi:hypothetical protein